MRKLLLASALALGVSSATAQFEPVARSGWVPSSEIVVNDGQMNLCDGTRAIIRAVPYLEGPDKTPAATIEIQCPDMPPSGLGLYVPGGGSVTGIRFIGTGEK